MNKLINYIVSCLVALMVFLIIVMPVSIYNTNQKILLLERQVETKDKTISMLQSQVKDLSKQVDKLSGLIESNRQELSKKVNRGDADRKTMTVTAYNESFECCGKRPGHPTYGITASGEKVKEWYTVAAGRELPFGTKVYIPYFRDKPNKGIFTVMDRGVSENCIDIYMPDGGDCREFGRRELEVLVLR